MTPAARPGRGPRPGRRGRGGAGRIARFGAARRRVQTVVLALATLVSVAASVLGVGLLLASNAPFDGAFAAQHGAHLRVDFDGSATASQLAATASVPGVTAAAGPFPTAQVRISTNSEHSTSVPAGGTDTGHDLGLLTVAGRSSPRATVDHLTLIAGRWANRPGEIVLDPTGLAMNIGDEFLGMRLHATTGHGTVDVQVVGLARSVTGTANAWAPPATVARLAGGRIGFQILYRFADARTPAQLAADRRAIKAAAPRGAVTGTSSYLSIRQQLTANAAAFTPFVIAFGVLAMLLSVLVTGIVVSGSVGAARRRIGIVKAIGFTPWQVARSYLRQTLIPVLAAVVAGAAAALALSRPVLSGIDRAYGGATASIPWWVVAAVSCGVILLVALAAALPALRIARVPAVTVLRGGRRASPSRLGRRVQRAVGALPLPRPVGLGLAAPLRRPTRALAMGATVLTGTACLSFAIGLMSSLGAVQHARNPLTGAAVQVGPSFPATPFDGSLPAEPVISDPAAVARTIAAMPQTRAVVDITDATVGVPGLVGGVDVAALSGDSSFTAHQMVAGHWITGAGQVVLPTRAFAQTGTSIGNRITLTGSGRSVTATVVGEVFDLTHDGQRLYTDASTLTALGIAAAPQQFLVDLRPGTDVNAYLDTLGPTIARYGAEADAAGDGSSSVIVAMNAITGLLTVMLLLVAGIGVSATVMLETRERTRDLGVFKSLGMTPWQTVTMTVTSACGTGLLAGAMGVPIGVAVHHAVVPAMGATAGAVLTPSQIFVYTTPLVALLLAGGLILAVLAAAGPAGWAARAPSAAALRTE